MVAPGENATKNTTENSAENSVERASGKGAGDENFPVGSFLIAKSLRPHVAIFYAFARAIDDIADDPGLPADEKISRLDGFKAAIEGSNPDPAYGKGHRIARSLDQTGVSRRHCLDLISAFKQDAVKGRYSDWYELMDYCDRSAAPVGRYLLDLHGEDRAAYRYSDALCNALQVINHLQDCQDDYLSMDRVYLPGDWLAGAGATVEELSGQQSSPALLSVIRRCAERTSLLLAEARLLPAALRSRRLAMESAFIVRIGLKLNRMLAVADPLAARVELGKLQFLVSGLSGALPVLLTHRAGAKAPN
ncbi:MAG: squalene synthase HpnC [Sphingomonadales bacterium]